MTEKSFVDFVRLVRKSNGRRVDTFPRLAAEKEIRDRYGVGRVVEKAAMSEQSGSVGGYTVPTDYSTKLLKVIAEQSFVFQRANVVPMSSQSMRCPKIDVETVSGTAGVPNTIGGVTFSWGFEQAPSETADAKFRQQDLRAWDLIGNAVVSNDFLDDIGDDGEEALLRMFGRAGSWAAEYAFLNGLGAGSQMPLGIIPAPGTITVARKTASHVSVEDIAGMAAKLMPGSWKSAIWACSPPCLKDIAAISNFFLNAARSEDDSSLVGWLMFSPLFSTEKLPALGMTGDLCLFDPQLYTVGLRREVIVDVSEHALFRTNQTVMRVWMRVDGSPQVSKPVTGADNSTTFSPYVILGPAS